jgi:tRNA(Ile)-lysidine synthase
MRLAVKEIRGDTRDVEFSDIEGCVQSILSGERFGITLSRGTVRVSVSREEVEISIIAPASSALPFSVVLELPGTTIAPELGCRATTYYAEPSSSGVRTSDLILVTDADCVQLPLTLRNRRPGDRIQPIGMSGHRKVQDILVDRKVPASQRDSVPIVEDDQGIIWVAGHSVTDRVRITDTTSRMLIIEIESLKSHFS